MLVRDVTSGTGANPIFFNFAGEGARKVILLALSLNEEDKALVSGYADAIENRARGFLEAEGYSVGSAQFIRVLEPGDDPNALVGFSANVYHEAEETEQSVEP